MGADFPIASAISAIVEYVSANVDVWDFYFSFESLSICQRPVNENHAQYVMYLLIFTTAFGSASFIFPASTVSLIIRDNQVSIKSTLPSKKSIMFK